MDGSLGLRISTPELKTDEKVALMDVVGKNLTILIQPQDVTSPGLKEVRGEFDTKTPSKRLRDVLYVLWKQSEDVPDWDTFYRQKIEGLIEKVKLKLTPQ